MQKRDAPDPGWNIQANKMQKVTRQVPDGTFVQRGQGNFELIPVASTKTLARALEPKSA